jgi:hypothetical protein
VIFTEGDFREYYINNLYTTHPVMCWVTVLDLGSSCLLPCRHERHFLPQVAAVPTATMEALLRAAAPVASKACYAPCSQGASSASIRASRSFNARRTCAMNMQLLSSRAAVSWDIQLEGGAVLDDGVRGLQSVWARRPAPWSSACGGPPHSCQKFRSSGSRNVIEGQGSTFQGIRFD